MVAASQFPGDPFQVLIINGVGYLALDGGFKLLIGVIAHHAVLLPSDEVQGEVLLAVASDHADGQGIGQQGKKLRAVWLHEISLPIHILLAVMENGL